VFDCEARDLGPAQLLRIGYVHQEARLLEWMRVEQLLRFVSAHYPTWNRDVEQGFISTFEVPLRTRVAALSSGERQKLSILLAIGHEPELLVLDEPATALDPVARARFLGLLMGFIQDLRRTVIISSHILSDVEKVIDHVWLLSDAALICDVPFDELQERYLGVELSSGGACPPASAFPGFVSGRSAGREASLVVRRDAWSAADLSGYTVRERNLDLEGLYRAVLSERKGGEL
jgi:ABC-2 type transport system ATP-binding protein